jgi:hypothetical protein
MLLTDILFRDQNAMSKKTFRILGRKYIITGGFLTFNSWISRRRLKKPKRPAQKANSHFGEPKPSKARLVARFFIPS